MAQPRLAVLALPLVALIVTVAFGAPAGDKKTCSRGAQLEKLLDKDTNSKESESEELDPAAAKEAKQVSGAPRINRKPVRMEQLKAVEHGGGHTMEYPVEYQSTAKHSPKPSRTKGTPSPSVKASSPAPPPPEESKGWWTKVKEWFHGLVTKKEK